jgi:hypothetical protein
MNVIHPLIEWMNVSRPANQSRFADKRIDMRNLGCSKSGATNGKQFHTQQTRRKTRASHQ